MGISALSAERPNAPLEIDRCILLNAEELAETIWRDKGCPLAGPKAFVAVARQVLELARNGALSADE